eukprot:TRINITY_DN60834_c0_g1_i1.p1 TRINITY_DN60834_c0_g1~~TRINITY_DN60834_c0_g1_i1.p1  ORF type:complete len:308 (+),score=84.94 TRINITY_DN60834_c0_g1_i1:105-1028(+)
MLRSLVGSEMCIRDRDSWDGCAMSSRSSSVLGWSRPAASSHVQRVQSFGVTRHPKPHRHGPRRNDLPERANSAPLLDDHPRNMDAIEEAMDDGHDNTLHDNTLPKLHSDFRMLSQTVSRHLNQPTEPVQSAENVAFVKELESSIEHELCVLGCPPNGPSLPRLQVYRQCFDILIKHFRAYRPMLSMIKQEYDKHLESLVSECESLQQLESEVGLAKYKREQDMVSTLKEYKQMQQGLEATLENKQDQIRRTKQRLSDLREEVAKYKGIQDSLAKSLEEGQCSNKNLRSRVEHLVDCLLYTSPSPRDS